MIHSLAKLSHFGFSPRILRSINSFFADNNVRVEFKESRRPNTAINCRMYCKRITIQSLKERQYKTLKNEWIPLVNAAKLNRSLERSICYNLHGILLMILNISPKKTKELKVFFFLCVCVDSGQWTFEPVHIASFRFQVVSVIRIWMFFKETIARYGAIEF